MNILSVNASVIGGGAEKVALTLHQRYLELGHESWLAVASLNAEEPATLAIPRDAGRGLWTRSLLGPAWWLDARSRRATDAAGRASRALRVAAEPGRWARIARGHEDFDFPWTRDLLALAPARADILHLHNLHGSYFDIRMLPELTATVPTVLTLHDTWLLTGHCAQPFECERWRTGCGDCPDLDRYVPVRGEETAANRGVKRSALLGSRLGIAAPSAWLLSMAEESGLLGDGREGRVIPNGVDTAVFAPGDKAEARERLGLPQERRIALVAAKGVRGNPYKGFDTLLGALGRLSSEASDGLLVVALGDEGQDWVVDGVELRVVLFSDDPQVVADYYRAADVFVHPSRADNLPLAPIEAMACGTPVVVSDAGGLPEIVVDGGSGLMFAAGDPDELASRLEVLLTDGALRERLSSAGSERVRDRFTLDRQVDAYLAWYAELKDERAADRSGVAHRL